MTAALHVLATALYLAAGTSTETPAGEATIPLDQLLPLLQQKAPAKADAPPPVDAVVTRAELKGRLTTDAIHVDAHFEVRVLAAGRWTRVPLLGVSPEAVLSSDPKVGDGVVVAIHGGELLLLAHEPGAYPVDATLVVRAVPSGSRRTVSLKVAPGGPPVPLQLEVDPAFTVVEPAAGGEPSVAVYPRAGEWSVGWTVAAPKAAAKVAQRPALEPKITRARAVWVSTLEGKLGLRVLYSLRLNRAEKISVEPPPGYRLERAAVNGRAVPLPEAGHALDVEVAPPNPGDTEAKLELALAEDLGVFHLSGNVNLKLPRASWPIADVSAEAYLPAVFNYRRQGGSLEQVLDGAEAWDAAFGTPFAEGEVLPGKVLRFRQYLVSSSSPDVALGYSVDIAKSYFQ
ncbi:MAG TPA: hypothetical protein VFA20_35625 [Myxococcaceae bacterium]|nr:hypothetical protein [Myxococcaceae bacterium]